MPERLALPDQCWLYRTDERTGGEQNTMSLTFTMLSDSTSYRCRRQARRASSLDMPYSSLVHMERERLLLHSPYELDVCKAPFCLVYSTEVKKTEVLAEAFRRAIRKRFGHRIDTD